MDFLLFLQNFRESSNGLFTAFFQKATFFGELNTVLVLLAIVYWCIDKETGRFLMTGWCWNRLLNGFLKITACIYRPWISDPRIVPDASAVSTATGYSFPSGHATNAGSFFGGIAIKKKGEVKTSLRVLCIIIVLCNVFSRLYLGVHTPLDVFVGLGASVAVMFLCRIVLDRTKDKKNADIVVAAICVVIGIAIAIYASVKSYPVDYDAEGKLLVDGHKMAADSFKGVGWNLGFFIGAIIERRYVHFTSDGTMQERAVRLVGGLLGFYIVNLIVCNVLKLFITGNIATILTSFLQMFYIVLVFPWIISLTQKENRAKSREELKAQA